LRAKVLAIARFFGTEISKLKYKKHVLLRKKHIYSDYNTFDLLFPLEMLSSLA